MGIITKALAALLIGLPSVAMAQQICFFEHHNYEGQSFCASESSNWVGGAWNDRISSVRVPSGYSVTLFADINYAGRSVQLASDSASLPNLNFNDIASSFRVKRPNTSVGKVLGTYYFTDVVVPRLRDIDPSYNVVYLFAARQAGGEAPGTLRFNLPPDGNGSATNWNADMQFARTQQGRKMILSVGGAGSAVRFVDRNVSTTFVDSVDRLYRDWGGFDGLDFNTFENGVSPNTSEMIWVAKELKRRHPGFIITAPPAPWNVEDRQFCKDMLTAGALDYCAPQYYDGPDLSDPAWVRNNIGIWMNLLGPEHVVVGFGVNNELNNYWKTADSAATMFQEIKSQYPEVKGAFDWRLDWDARDGYPFAKKFAPLVR